MSKKLTGLATPEAESNWRAVKDARRAYAEEDYVPPQSLAAPPREEEEAFAYFFDNGRRST